MQLDAAISRQQVPQSPWPPWTTHINPEGNDLASENQGLNSIASAPSERREKGVTSIRSCMYISINANQNHSHSIS